MSKKATIRQRTRDHNRNVKARRTKKVKKSNGSGATEVTRSRGFFARLFQRS